MMTGSYWLAERWLQAVTMSRELRTEVRKGRIIANRGRVMNLQVRPGLMTADVQSDTGGEHSVKIRMPTLDDEEWSEALDEISAEANHAANLLDGRLSVAIATIFERAGADLFAHDYRDMRHFCTTPELHAPLSVYAIATHFAFAEAIEANAFVLFEFRGRSRKELVAELRTRRSSSLSATSSVEDEGSEVESVKRLADGFWSRGVIPHLAFHFHSAPLSGADGLPVIRALGAAPLNTDPESVADVLAPIAKLATVRIDEVMNEVQRLQRQAPLSPDPNHASTLDDMLVAAAHQHGELTTSFVSNALGCNIVEARRYLSWLVEEGRLTKTGRARGTKYLPIEQGA